MFISEMIKLHEPNKICNMTILKYNHNLLVSPTGINMHYFRSVLDMGGSRV